MAVDCLKNVVGIDHTDNNDNPSSGLYMSTLEGIELNVADKSHPDKSKTGKNLIQQKIDEAGLEVKNRINDHIKPYMVKRSVLRNNNVGHYKPNLEAVSSESGVLKGIFIDIDRSPYLEFYLNTITIQLDSDVSVDVEVWDLMTGKKLDTITISAKQDEHTKSVVNNSYVTDGQRTQLFIGYDAGVAGTYETHIHKTMAGCRSCDRYYSNEFGTFSGQKIKKSDSKIQDNLDPINGSAGLSLDYSISCTAEQFVCNMANQIAWPMRYKAAQRIMLEMQVSKRLNSIVNIHGDTADFLQQFFEGRYEESMERVLQNMVIPADFCFACNQQIKNATRIP